MRLGIDFGTTRTVVACADRGNYPVLHFIDEAGDTHEWFPSVVAESEGELLFGFEALAQADKGATVVRSFKRVLADPRVIPGTPVRVGTRVVPVQELLTRFLAAVKRAVFAALSDSEYELQQPLRSVVGVPAHAHGAQRFITLDAFRAAGLNPVAMLNEPSAAGFEFTHRHRDRLSSRRDHIVIYDLGGGTFDASLVRMRGRSHEVLATAGLNRLGGDDFDDVLLELVIARADQARGELSAPALERLLDQCREAKERLSPSSRKISIDLESSLGGANGRDAVTISVGDYYDACLPLLERTLATMSPVMSRLDNAVANEAGGGIAGIYVVGGGSSLPIVLRTLRKNFGRKVHKSPYPSAAVAIGLSIACDEQAGFELSDRYARTFGVFREAAEGHEITFDPIFSGETRLPNRSGDVVRLRRAYRAAHNIGHFRFLECSAVSSDGRPRGDIVPSGDVLFPFDPALQSALDLARVPISRNPASGPHIEEEYTLDEHGMVAVTIRNLDANYQQVYRIGDAPARRVS